MARDKDFSIISVNPADDEDIVIQAGISQTLEEDVDTEILSEEDVDTEILSESEPVEIEEDDYRRTTLEDLEANEPLPKARLAIIAAGALVIVGMVVYFLVIF